MSVLQPRTNFNDKIRNVLFMCQYKNMPIKLVGSSSLQSQQYFGDYDALTTINKKEKPDEIYSEFMRIFKNVKNDPDLYFIEFKIQTMDDKFKFFKNDNLNLQDFKKHYENTDFYKLDLVMWFEYQFVEVSVIYQLLKLDRDVIANPETKLKKENTENINSLEEDIKDLIKEKKYYKILKRKFSIYKLEGNEKKMSQLTKIFNSDLGLKYKVASNLEAMDLVKEHYTDHITKERIKINLQYLNLHQYKINDLMKEAKKMKNEINIEAEKYLKKFGL